MHAHGGAIQASAFLCSSVRTRLPSQLFRTYIFDIQREGPSK